MWQNLISPITTILGWGMTTLTEYIEHKRQLKLLERQAEIEAAKVEIANAANADAVAVEDAKKSWKDEITLAVIYVPFVGCFIPGAAPYIKQGFMIINTVVPNWFTALFTALCLSVMGARVMAKHILPRIKDK